MLATVCGIIIASVISGIIMLIITLSMIAATSKLGSGETTVVKNNTFLTVDLGRIAGDRTAGKLHQAFGDNKTVGLVDAVNAIRAAATDDKIAGLLLKASATQSVSWASLTELRAAIAEFSQSGKPVVSYATGYSQGAYYLCSAADRVCLHPSGMIDFRGMGAEVIYYKDLLDKLGVDMQLIRPESCSYKSAGEVYTLNHMSAANREQIRAYIKSIWGTAVDAIAASRGIEPAELNRIADNLSGYLADDACAHHLVDTLCFEEDVRHMLRNDYDGRQLLALEKYATNVKLIPNTATDAIAIIYAEGNVMDGTSRGLDEGVFGDDIVKALRQAADNDNVKAIVLRVNSPGGQATASESMTHAVMQARDKKPVIVSMGDLAASAGYEMSCMADAIVAQPTTVTGSIGVFGTIPNLGRMMKQKLGLNADTVSTNSNSASLSVFRPLSPTAMAMMNRNVEDFYKVFVGRVAEGRHMTYDQVHQIARGRVWTGADAVKIGLVDTLGGLDLALSIAAEKAGIETYRTIDYPTEKDVWTQLMSLSGSKDDDNSLPAKARLVWLWRTKHLPQPISRWQQDLLYISQAEGLQARLPFVITSE